MESGLGDEILRQAASVANEHYEKLETDTARMLIESSFALLPWELQEGYWEVQDLYRSRRFHAANLAWEAWMDQARDMGLL